ncbi:MAG: glycosyltransferase family 2 protein, partial [Gemmatimonadota bacterium]
MSTQLLLALPWIVAALALPWAIRRRPRLSESPPVTEDAPLASIIVPARNEAPNLGTCVGTLLASAYPAFEILIVDDRSSDGTADIARELARSNPDRIRFIEGRALPDGWVGKCWACWQGYREARGDVLVFTDADTRHGRSLLGHAVSALESRGAALVTGFPRQLMNGFWERLILPHIFTAIELRYRDPARMNRSRKVRDAVANGQFLVFRRDAYEAIGGHEAVRGEIVEDIRIAQLVVAAGRRVFTAWAKDVIETRMYRSLADIVEGWSKNLARGSRHSVDPWLRPLLPGLVAAFQIGFWVAPPALLVAAIAGGSVPLIWAATTTTASLVFWLIRHLQFRAPIAYTLLFPIGAAAVALLFLRSAWLGENVTWKG